MVLLTTLFYAYHPFFFLQAPCVRTHLQSLVSVDTVSTFSKLALHDKHNFARLT